MTTPEIETPASQTAGARWNLFEKSASSDSLRTAADVAAAKAAIDEAVASEQFPDFKNSLALLAKLNAETVSSKEEWQSKQPRLMALKKHIFQVQQGMPVVQTTADQQIEPTVHRRAGQTHRVTRAKALQSFLKLAMPKFAPVEPYDLVEPPRDRLMAEPVILEKLWQCRRLLAEAELFAIKNFDLENPVSRISELQHAFTGVKTTAELRDIAAELAFLKSDDFQTNVPRLARSMIEAQFDPALKAIAGLISTCKELISAWLDEARQRTDEFFGKHGLAADRNALVQKFENALTALPTVNKAALAWFGIDDVATE